MTSLWRYKIPFTKPLVLKGKEYTHREGLIVKIKGFGEIAPLPGFSKESLEEAEKDAILSLQSKKTSKLSSVQFGISTALKEDLSFPPLSIANLLWGTKEEILSRAESLMGESKVKVSAFSIEETIDLLKILRKRFPKLRLRIDSNQKWSLEEALYFSKHFTKEDFSFLEEPVKSFEELLEFSKKTSFPIAADESLLTHPIETILSLPSLKAVVIKPTLYFPFKVPCRVIYSSSFETGIGLSAIANLAHSHGSKDPLGLDTYRFFKEDLLSEPLFFSKGSVYPSPLSIKEEFLCPIFSVP